LVPFHLKAGKGMERTLPSSNRYFSAEHPGGKPRLSFISDPRPFPRKNENRAGSRR
jgi:hypothetical protein